MKIETETAVKALVKKAGEEGEPHKAMQFAQAALNLAHVLVMLDGIERGKK